MDIFKLDDYNFRQFEEFETNYIKGCLDILEEFCEFKFELPENLSTGHLSRTLYCKFVKREFLMIISYE